MKKIAIMANSSFCDGLNGQALDNKYLEPIIDICQAMPVIVPTMACPNLIQALFNEVDGIILTGDESNIHPTHYQQIADDTIKGPFDRQRDSVAFQLIAAAVSKHKPLLGICRGMQELNVGLGGSLQSGVYDNPCYSSHIKQQFTDIDKRYGIAHTVTFQPGTQLASVFANATVGVNSLHEQAIDDIAPDLAIAAYSDDGIIEAIELREYSGIFGVQWHPEYKAQENPTSLAIFEQFKRFL